MKALGICNNIVSAYKLYNVHHIAYSIFFYFAFIFLILFFFSFCFIQFNVLSFILICVAWSTTCTAYTDVYLDPKEISNLKYIFITITQLPNFSVFSPFDVRFNCVDARFVTTTVTILLFSYSLFRRYIVSFAPYTVLFLSCFYSMLRLSLWNWLSSFFLVLFICFQSINDFSVNNFVFFLSSKTIRNKLNCRKKRDKCLHIWNCNDGNLD